MKDKNMPLNLERLCHVSSKMGKDSLLIQGTGGNTSLKEDGVLWVKASGKSLAGALEENIFIPLDLAQAVEQVEHLSSNHELSFLPLNKDDLRPSIETVLHALMPHQVVLHSHPIDIIALSLMPESKIFLCEALKDLRWHYIPYSRPGKPLAMAVAAALASNPADVLILANHGLVVGASSPEQAFSLQAQLTKRLVQMPRQPTNLNKHEMSKWVSRIPGARLPGATVIHTIATDPFSHELATQYPPYPDHVVFCGIHPWLITKNYIPPNPDTAYGLIPGVGVVLLEAASPATEAMLKAQAEVYLRIPPGRKVNLLSHDQSLELVDWDAEKYRRAIGREA